MNLRFEYDKHLIVYDLFCNDKRIIDSVIYPQEFTLLNDLSLNILKKGLHDFTLLEFKNLIVHIKSRLFINPDKKESNLLNKLQILYSVVLVIKQKKQI
jgi:hypothetical protein